GTISFLANPKYVKYIYETKASAVIVSDDFVPEQEVSCTLIKVDNPYQSLAILLQEYQKLKMVHPGREEPVYIDESAQIGKDLYLGAFAYIGKNAKIGNNVKIYPHCYIGQGAEIGDDTILYSGVKVYDDCKIGKECIVHSGTIVGSDGFGFAPNSENNYQKVPQIGNVVIEDHVEIGSNTTIDRATMGSTIIRKGVKIDNLIQIAHNVEIGKNTVIAAQTGISGSTKLGERIMIGGQVGIIGHLKIADDVKIAAQSGVGKSIEKSGEIIQGSPAFQVGDYQKSYVVFRRLPEVRKQIIDLEKQLEELKKKLED
ncbi:MAG: UDP-3-O-(3-hydroxymyristoyl)glucosamine N-acyltransferase, partial [Marinilabiliales bacterium]